MQIDSYAGGNSISYYLHKGQIEQISIINHFSHCPEKLAPMELKFHYVF